MFEKDLHDDDKGDVFCEGVGLDVEAVVFEVDVGLGLALVRATGDRGVEEALSVGLKDDAVVAELLVDEDDLLDSSDHKVSTRIEWALTQSRQLFFGFVVQHTFVATQHHRHPSDAHCCRDDLLVLGVLDVGHDPRCV